MVSSVNKKEELVVFRLGLKIDVRRSFSCIVICGGEVIRGVVFWGQYLWLSIDGGPLQRKDIERTPVFYHQSVRFMRLRQFLLFSLVIIAFLLGLVIGLGVPYFRGTTVVQLSKEPVKSVEAERTQPQAAVDKVTPKKDFLAHPKLDPVYLPHGLGGGVDDLFDKDLADIADYRPLLLLHLGSQGYLTDVALEYVGQLHELESLSLDGTKITDKGLALLGKLERLKELRLNDCDRLKGSGIQSLSNLGALEYLEIVHGGLHDLPIKEGFRSLEEIKAGGNYLETVRLDGLFSLRKLNLNTYSQLRCIELKCLLVLESLNVFSDEPRRPEKLFLSGLPALRHVVLNLPLADEDVEQLDSPMSDQLETLILPDPVNTISGKSVKLIGKMSNLKVLHLCGKFRDEDLIHLRYMPKLKKLSLEGSPIDGSGLQWLTQLDELETLSLESTDVELKNLEKWLPKMPYLRKINLENTQISNADKLKLLKSLPWLREVSNDGEQILPDSNDKSTIPFTKKEMGTSPIIAKRGWF